MGDQDKPDLLASMEAPLTPAVYVCLGNSWQAWGLLGNLGWRGVRRPANHPRIDSLHNPSRKHPTDASCSFVMASHSGIREKLEGKGQTPQASTNPASARIFSFPGGIRTFPSTCLHVPYHLLCLHKIARRSLDPS